ncbi:MAG TPA: hypothetical protein VN973_12620 [Candidatus Dormibacteraeota bacterium]|nr:hypothetical protein [Candidatus Dormibacteraeota bacterium]
MQNNPIQNNPMAFFVGIVIFFIGLLATVFYLFVRTATESLILPGPTLRLKHIILALVIAAAGAALASFARPRGPATSDQPGYNR